jgi:hypothetical protein
MLKTQWHQWLTRIPMNRPARRQGRTTRRRLDTIQAAAEILEVLENRLLLTPSLVFALQPGNATAGHGLSAFTVDVVNSGLHRRGTSDIDTSYNGICLLTANGPGVLDEPADSPVNPNVPLNIWWVGIFRGVGEYLARFDTAALDVAGTYTLTATSPAGIPVPIFPGGGGPTTNPGIAGSANSARFTVSADTASDHLVFLNGPYLIGAGVPFNVPVAVEDQFGNIDTSISKASAYLDVIGSGGLGATYLAEFSAGQATFTDVTLPAAPPSTNPFSQDTLLGIGFAGPMGIVFGTTTAVVVSPTTGN